MTDYAYNYLNHYQGGRDKVLFGEFAQDKYVQGIRNFDNLSVKDLKYLINNGYVDTLRKFNNSPTIQIIFDYMNKYKYYFAKGFAIWRYRDDYGIYITGLKKCSEFKINKQEAEDFQKTFNNAEQLIIGDYELFCSFDFNDN